MLRCKSTFASSADQRFVIVNSCSVLSFSLIASLSLRAWSRNITVEIWCPLCYSEARSAGIRHQEASDFVCCWRRQNIDRWPGGADSSIWRLCKLWLLSLSVTMMKSFCNVVGRSLFIVFTAPHQKSEKLSLEIFVCVIKLQGVSIACYAEPCISYDRVVRPSVCPSHAGSEWKQCKLGLRNPHRRIAQGL